MRALRGGAGLLVLFALGASACAGGSPEPPPPSAERPVACRTDVRPGRPFHRAGGQHIRQAGRLAVRETYRSASGRTLTLFAGVVGEFGEGSPFHGRLPLVMGGTGRFYGAEPNWILVWRGPSPCAPRAIIGQGFSRPGFIRTLRAMSVVGLTSSGD